MKRTRAHFTLAQSCVMEIARPHWLSIHNGADAWIVKLAVYDGHF